MKEIRTRNTEIYSILNKLKATNGVDISKLDNDILKKISKYTKTKGEKIYLPPDIKIYKIV